MTVGELIERLQQFDPNLVVIYDAYYETESPLPRLREGSKYGVNYWDDGKIHRIPIDANYVEL